MLPGKTWLKIRPASLLGDPMIGMSSEVTSTAPGHQSLRKGRYVLSNVTRIVKSRPFVVVILTLLVWSLAALNHPWGGHTPVSPIRQESTAVTQATDKGAITTRLPLTQLYIDADAKFANVGASDPETLRHDLEAFVTSHFPVIDSKQDDPDSLLNVLRSFLPPPTSSETADTLQGGLPSLILLAFRSLVGLLSTSDSLKPPKLAEWQPLIPKRIFQTGAHKGAHPPEDAATQSWSQLNSDYDIHYLDDPSALAYINARFNESLLREDGIVGIAGTFRSMKDVPVMQSDLLRYALLATEGGIYSDLDTSCTKAIDHWHRTAATEHHDVLAQENGRKKYLRPAVILGIEMDAVSPRHPISWWERVWPAPLSIVQWTFASTRGHPIFIDALRRVVTSTRSRWQDFETIPADITQMDVLRTTGPVILSDSVLRYLGSKYNVTWADLRDIPEEGLLFGSEEMPADVLILSFAAFNHGFGGYIGQNVGMNDDRVLVHHHYANSWKKGRRPGY